MKKNNFAIFGLLMAIILLAGCASMGDVMKSKDKGTVKVYPVTADQAWEISKTVFRWEGCDAIEEHRDEGYMLTSSGVNMVSWGAVMGAWIDPVDENTTKVTCVTKRRISINVATTHADGAAFAGGLIPGRPAARGPQAVDRPSP